jgi:hypothetical protein
VGNNGIQHRHDTGHPAASCRDMWWASHAAMNSNKANPPANRITDSLGTAPQAVTKQHLHWTHQHWTTGGFSRSQHAMPCQHECVHGTPLKPNCRCAQASCLTVGTKYHASDHWHR